MNSLQKIFTDPMVCLISLLLLGLTSWNMGHQEGYGNGKAEGVAAGWIQVRDAAARLDIIAPSPIVVTGSATLKDLHILLLQEGCSAINISSSSTSFIGKTSIEMIGEN